MDLSALEFQIINCLGSQNFTLKKMACLQSCISVDPFSQSLFMGTNIFKKEMMKSNHIEISCILNCITNIVDKELGPRIIKEAMKLLKSTNVLIRKKALVLVAQIFTHAPQTIQGNLEIILNQIIPQESNPTVLACFTSVVQTVLNTQPKLYPLFVKPLYEILQKQKSNWFMIKLVKTFHKMLKLEPRLIKKLSDQYLQVLQNNKSKALEYEVLSSTIEYFQEEKELYELACQKLRSLIDHKDGNLRNLGFILLNKTIQGNQSILEEYKEFLIQNYENANDQFTKIQILEIFQNYITKEMFKTVIEAILANLEKENNKIINKIIHFVIILSQKNDFELINDFDWLLNKVIFNICKFVDDMECAVMIQQLIYSIMVRVEGTKQLIFNLSINIIKYLNENQENLFENTKQYLNIPQISAKEKIFQTLVFLIGEHSNLIKDKNNLKALFKFFNQEKILLKYRFSYTEIQSSLFKVSFL
ncbi:hypothetical protein IMG5_194460 [Ichthyophthirius multifiliis]|uniref:Clathrin/coatomer adaptor adaptin-like N-terminal domain-containing protein n=1 Tax=Ichthyophthirius multifiliis TaxID=5932 RepID=G0R4R8_ICHMU|nr:hypothetical protein IMG5_194460 [Ichthyophthirius multifiliis]EGR27538.1 hypothetical protein IMG5_194460 [Ichthyophthirius multifiliis]|eukprot:XP_004024990.1 hypothetical protein IMG5_194460 [Ichthyophthirius multifiliis]